MKFTLRPAVEKVGVPECPLFRRWTFLDSAPLKVMVHHFTPNMDDPDGAHDHPRSFVTAVLWGRYFDVVPCPACDGAGDCGRCTGGQFGSGRVLGEIMAAPKIRFRPADHAHWTRTDSAGAWTLVVMGKITRPWGFWKDGSWWPFKEYEQTFGFKRVCD